MEQKEDFTKGKLYAFCTKLYQLIVIYFCFLISISPTLLLLLFLERSIQNSLLWGLAIVPVGPALAATFATMLLLQDGKLISPFRDYWQKYVINLKDSLKLWIIYTIAIVILFVDIFYFNQSTYNFFSWFMIFLIIVSTIVVIIAMIITIKYSFSTKNILKITSYYCLTKISIPLKILSYIIIFLAIMVLFSETFAFIGISYLIWVCLKTVNPILVAIENEFVQSK